MLFPAGKLAKLVKDFCNKVINDNSVKLKILKPI